MQLLYNIDWKSFGEAIYQSPNFWYCLAALTLVLYLWKRIRSRRSNFRLQKTDSGYITVSRHALTTLIKNEAAKILNGKVIRVSLRLRSGRIYARIKVRLHKDNRVEQVSKDLQEHLQQVLTQDMGIEQIGSIDILIVDFFEDPKPKETHPEPHKEVAQEEA